LTVFALHVSVRGSGELSLGGVTFELGRSKSGGNMKKMKKESADERGDELRKEYDLSKLEGGV
jgi:hypothetical protein